MEPGKKPEGLEAKSKDWEADFDFEPDEKHKTVSVTERGVAKAEKFLGIDNLYRAEYGNLVNHLQQALKAESLYKRDVDYAVIDGEVKIIDEFTGRILEGRRWSEGLHQAVEAKEGVAIQEETQTVATITYQNYFRRYDKLAGMTGTALTEATEFMKIYELQVVEIPTNRPMVRDDQQRPDLQDQGRQVGRRRQRDRGAQRHRPAGARRHDLGRGLGAALAAARQGGHQAHGAEREARARRARGRDHRRGGPPVRGHDRHQHGRPRRGHQARRQRGAPHPGRAHQARPRAGHRRVEHGLGRAVPEDGAAGGGGPREGHGVRRPVHLRHRAPRVAPDRQPAARPLRPPGRPGRVALLPVRRGRPRAPVRRRPHLQDPRQQVPRSGRRGRQRAADRAQDALEADRGRPEEGRGAELPDPQARPRVRRRDEPAARDHLRVPRPDPRGPGHVGDRARADRRRDRADRARVHGGRVPGGLGARRAVRRSSGRSTTVSYEVDDIKEGTRPRDARRRSFART